MDRVAAGLLVAVLLLAAAVFALLAAYSSDPWTRTVWAIAAAAPLWLAVEISWLQMEMRQRRMKAVRQAQRQVMIWLRSRSLRRFLVVGIVGRAAQTLLLWLFTDWLGVYYIVSSLLAVATVFGLGYLANRYWVFARMDTR